MHGKKRVDDELHELRERLAALEHEQWSAWSRSVAETEKLSAERSAAWEQSWLPYEELPESEKELDREYADRVIALLERMRLLRGEGGRDV